MFLGLVPSNLCATYLEAGCKSLGGLLEGLHDLGRNELFGGRETIHRLGGFELGCGFPLEVCVIRSSQVVTCHHAGAQVKVREPQFPLPSWRIEDIRVQELFGSCILSAVERSDVTTQLRVVIRCLNCTGVSCVDLCDGVFGFLIIWFLTQNLLKESLRPFVIF